MAARYKRNSMIEDKYKVSSQRRLLKTGKNARAMLETYVSTNDDAYDSTC